MIVEVKHQSRQYDLSVVVDGRCNHAATEIETEYFNGMNAQGEDTVVTELMEICVKCKCWRPMGTKKWYGVGMMPM